MGHAAVSLWFVPGQKLSTSRICRGYFMSRNTYRLVAVHRYPVTGRRWVRES